VQPLDSYPQDHTQSSLQTNYEKNEQTKEVLTAINQLDKDSRDVIILRFLIGLNPLEIAGALDKTEGNIRVIQHRALKKLESLMKEND